MSCGNRKSPLRGTTPRGRCLSNVSLLVFPPNHMICILWIDCPRAFMIRARPGIVLVRRSPFSTTTRVEGRLGTSSVWNMVRVCASSIWPVMTRTGRLPMSTFPMIVMFTRCAIKIVCIPTLRYLRACHDANRVTVLRASFSASIRSSPLAFSMSVWSMYSSRMTSIGANRSAFFTSSGRCTHVPASGYLASTCERRTCSSSIHFMCAAITPGPVIGIPVDGLTSMPSSLPLEHTTPGRPRQRRANGPFGSTMCTCPRRVGSHGMGLQSTCAATISAMEVFPEAVPPLTQACGLVSPRVMVCCSPVSKLRPR